MRFSSGNAKYIAIFLLAVIFVFGVIFLTPKPLDWSPSFSKDDTIPYGGFVTHALLSEMSPGSEISVAQRPIYNTVGEDTLQNTNYIFVNQSFQPDPLDSRELLRFVASGNVAFIAAQVFTGKIADTLNLATNNDVVAFDSVRINFVNPRLRMEQDFVHRKNTVSYYFSRLDSLRAVVLGTNSEGHTNFLKMRFGHGVLLLSTVPLAFTNYNALHATNAEYIFRAFSYLPIQAVIWDEYYKIGNRLGSSPLRFVLSREPLKWAYFVALTGIILFIVFEGKRRQKPIRVIRPLANMTLEFVETVGRLYHQKGDHKNLADKKIVYFFDHVRSRFHLKTTEISDVFLDKLASRSGVAIAEIRKLFAMIRQVQNKEKMSEAELIELNSSLEHFYETSYE